MASRNQLHINKLEDFKCWLIGRNWTVEEPKGIYEVLRATKNRRTLIVYKKANAKEHLTVQDRDWHILREYLWEDKYEIHKLED